MTLFKNKYRVESNRCIWWNYSAPGQYYLTVCIQNRERMLGKVVNAEMILSPEGKILKSEILNIPTYHRRVILDEWVIMPDHIHMIVELGDYDYDNGMCGGDIIIEEIHGDDIEAIHELPLYSSPLPIKRWWHNPDYEPTTDEIKQYRKFRRRMIIPKVMGKLKMIVSKQINILNNTPGRKNWQSDYHDHIILNRRAYHNIKRYIINNPRKWEDKMRVDLKKPNR